MLIVAMVVVVGCVVGGAVLLGVRQWPAIDPAAPTGATHGVSETVRREALTSQFVRDRLDPAGTTGLAMTVAVVVATLGGALLGVLSLLVRDNPTVHRLDRSVATWSADHATDASTTLLRLVTALGSTTVVALLSVVVLLAAIRYGRAKATAGFLASVVLGQWLIANLVKILVDRARPAIDPLAGFSGPSFPSGHTVAAFACFAAFAMLLGRRSSPRIRALLIGLAFGIAVMVGASRVLLGVHWLTDVVGGAVLGTAWFSVCAVAFGGRLLRFGAPVEAGQRAAALPTQK